MQNILNSRATVIHKNKRNAAGNWWKDCASLG